MNLLGIAGKKRSGKDTVGKLLIEKYGYEKLYFAEEVYNGVYILNPIIYSNLEYDLFTDVSKIKNVRLQEIVDKHGWEYAKDNYDEVRRLLQTFGTEAGRDIHGFDCWVNIVKNKIDPNKKYVITDVRFDNEVDMIRKKYGCILLVERDGLDNFDEHSSEKGVEYFDYRIKNNGTLEELAEEIDNFLSTGLTI